MKRWSEQRSILNTTEGYYDGSHLCFNTIRQHMKAGLLPHGCLETKNGYEYNIVSDAKRFGNQEDYFFNVQILRHVTDFDGFKRICESGGFCGDRKFINLIEPDQSYSWWSIRLPDEHLNTFIQRAEDAEVTRGKVEVFPPFSIAAELYGNFAFHYTLSELLGQYDKQFCSGAELVVRILGTFVYRAEIQYAVLVHSSQYNAVFGHLREVHAKFRGQRIHRDNSRMYWTPETIFRTTQSPHAAWETMSFAFHLPGDGLFKMPGVLDKFCVVPCKRYKGLDDVSACSALRDAMERLGPGTVLADKLLDQMADADDYDDNYVLQQN